MAAAKYDIRPFRPGDEEGILATFNAVFGENDPSFVPRTRAEWDWAFARNPAGRRIWVAECEGVIAAQCAALPYRVYGGMRFFERAEVKHALAYLRLIAVQDDDGAFLRVVNFPPRGIGARTLEQLQDVARGRGTSLWQAAASGAVGGKAGNSLATFIKTIERLRAETASLPLMMQPRMEWLRGVRYRWEAIAHKWNVWVLGYNPERQRDLMQWVGIRDAD